MGPVDVRQKENVLIKAGGCSVQIFPELGGKIASIKVGARELLQTPLAPYGPRTRTMSFDAGDASGWDECFPSVAACSIDTETGPAAIPDHGDLWRIEWVDRGQRSTVRDLDRFAENGDPVPLTGECFSLPLSLERTVQAGGDGPGLEARTRLRRPQPGKVRRAVVVGGASVICCRGWRPDSSPELDQNAARGRVARESTGRERRHGELADDEADRWQQSRS